MSIASLRRSREATTEALAKKLAESSQSNNPDANVWKPYLDEEKGIGQAVIRLLPAPDGEELPMVTVYDHGFQGSNGKYYIEKSLTTIGKKDPVSDMNSRLWQSGGPKDDKGRTPDQHLASSMKRRTNYFANIQVISDPGRPQNEGKVFEYRFGPVVYEMIENALYPKFEGQKRMNPFDLWDGANLQLRIKRDGPKGKGFWKYTDSKFADPSELFPGDDDAKDAVWKQCKSLSARVAPESFKTYETLAARLLEVLGPTVGSGVATVENAPAEAAPEKPAVEVKKTVAATPAPKQEVKQEVQKAAAPAAEQDDDLSFFENLAKQS